MSLLRDIRKKNNYTAKFVADKMGIHYNTLMQIEREQQNAGTDLQEQLAAFYGVEPKELFPDYDPSKKIVEEITPLRKLREERGLTLTEVSDATGVNRGNLANIELGKTGMSGKVAKALSDFYGVELNAFRLSNLNDGERFNVELFHQLRMERQLSLNELAKRLGVDVGYLSKLEANKQGMPRFASLQKFADFFGLQPEDFIVGNKKKEAPLPDINEWLVKNSKFLLDGDEVHLATPEARERVLNMIRAGVAWEQAQQNNKK